jgi:hypothetical protein
MSNFEVVMDNGNTFVISAIDKSGAIHEAIRKYHILMKEVKTVNQISNYTMVIH